MNVLFLWVFLSFFDIIMCDLYIEVWRKDPHKLGNSFWKKRLSSKLFTWFANIVRRALSDYMEIEIVLLKHVFLFVCFLFLFVVEIFHYSFGQWIGSEQNHLCKCPNCVVIFYSSISLITLRMIVIHSDRHQCIYLYVFIELFFFSICLFSRFFSLLKP